MNIISSKGSSIETIGLHISEWHKSGPSYEFVSAIFKTNGSEVIQMESITITNFTYHPWLIIHCNSGTSRSFIWISKSIEDNKVKKRKWMATHLHYNTILKINNQVSDNMLKFHQPDKILVVCIIMPMAFHDYSSYPKVAPC